jgi:hypothetical protein
MLFRRVSQRQRTTHDMADREPSTRGSAALKTRRSSVQTRNLLASSTAAKYSSGAALQRSVDTPNAALTCSTPVDDTPARGSGRRGRRFKSCHPDQCHRSLTCGNAAPCARRPTSQQSPQRPRAPQKGTRGNPRESRGRLRRAEEHPAFPHDVADPAAQQGPSGHCDPPSATKRPFGRYVRRPGITADPKPASSSGSGPSPPPPRPRIRSPLAPSTRPNEFVQMTRGETFGRP